MNKYAKLLKNSGIFFLANFGSKILSFLLVPYYTYVLSAEEYGTSDIIITTATMLIPVVTLSISEAALRFAMDKEADLKKVLSNCVTVLGIGNIILSFFLPVIFLLGMPGKYIFLFYLLMLSGSIYVVTSQFCRGIGYVKHFAFGGVLSTASHIISNILLLLVFKMGITGYLISMVMSYAVPAVYYCFAIKIHKYFARPEKGLLKAMLRYSIPMIPSSFAWWAMTASDKYVLIYFLGSAANGLYVVSQKIPSLINILSLVFMQSWQISAIDESQSKDKSDFYSNIFNLLSATMLITISFMTAIIKPFYNIWVSNEYYDAWKYTTILLIANMFSCFSDFVATNYLAMKKTDRNLKTIIIGCLTNIVLNIILIPIFGIYAAAATTLIAFLVTWILRLMDTRDFVKIKFNYKRVIGVMIIIGVQFAAQFVWDNLIIQIALFSLTVMCFYKEINMLFKKAKEVLRKRKI